MAKKRAAKSKGKPSTSPSKTVPVPPVPKNSTQKRFIDSMIHKDMVIVTGPAGTGKTYLSACYAGYFYKRGDIKKIVLSRPTVATGKSIGYFPGTLEEKMEPWVTPFIGALEEYLTKGAVETMLKNGSIEIVPFEVIRGRTFDDAFIILDEAQNCTTVEIKAFVTRQGENSTTIINGDTTQSDLNGTGTGLTTVIKMVNRSTELQEHVEHILFNYEDIVRSDLCKIWVKEFDKQNS